MHFLSYTQALVDVVSNIFSEKNKEYLEELAIEMLDTEEGEKETVLDPNEIMQGENKLIALQTC